MVIGILVDVLVCFTTEGPDATAPAAASGPAKWGLSLSGTRRSTFLSTLHTYATTTHCPVPMLY